MTSALRNTLTVWYALILREALDRLFDMRGAWFWLLAEPAMHILFMSFIRVVIRMRTVANADALMWIVVGMLAFFLFRRTAVQVTHAVDSNRAFFAFRQVQPFDPALARAVLEAFLMAIVAIIILVATSFFDRQIIPDDPLLVLAAVLGLWLFGLGYGLVASVLQNLIPEMKHVLKILMMPLYLISGVIIPLSSIPQPYLSWLMYNPIAHALELVRLGYFAHYHTVPGVSMGYVYAWSVASICLGLLLYRRFAIQLTMR